MTAGQQGGQVAPAEAPAVRDIGTHTAEDHQAASSKRTYGEAAKVTEPYQEAASLPAPSLSQVKGKK
jgi:hypothetical protein